MAVCWMFSKVRGVLVTLLLWALYLACLHLGSGSWSADRSSVLPRSMLRLLRFRWEPSRGRLSLLRRTVLFPQASRRDRRRPVLEFRQSNVTGALIANADLFIKATRAEPRISPALPPTDHADLARRSNCLFVFWLVLFSLFSWTCRHRRQSEARSCFLRA